MSVSDSIGGGTLRFAIMEYAGLAASNSFDAAAAAQGTGLNPSSGNATTTAGGDLVIGVLATANGATFSAGSGFTIEDRVPAAPNTKLITQDRLQTAAGPIAATATLSAADAWGAAVAAFRAGDAGATDTIPPSAPGTLTATAVSGTRIDLAWGAATDNVGVTGYRVEQCLGAGCSNFVKLATVSGTTFSDTGLTPNTSYSYVVRAHRWSGTARPYSNIASATSSDHDPGTGRRLLVRRGSRHDGRRQLRERQPRHDRECARGRQRANSETPWSSTVRTLVVSVADAPSLHLTTGMTLEAWVNPSTITSAWRDVIYKGNDNYFLEATTTNGSAPGAGATVGSANTVAVRHDAARHEYVDAPCRNV